MLQTKNQTDWAHTNPIAATGGAAHCFFQEKRLKPSTVNLYKNLLVSPNQYPSVPTTCVIIIGLHFVIFKFRQTWYFWKQQLVVNQIKNDVI